MTAMHTPSGRVVMAIEVPELGPAMGRVAAPTPAGLSGGAEAALDRIRLELASAVFDAEADARAWSAAGDRTAAVEALGRAAWMAAWEAAVREAADLVAGEAERLVTDAARVARMPARRRPRLQPAERLALAARLAAPGVVLEGPLDQLEDAAARLPEVKSFDREAADQWGSALTALARKLEAGWLGLAATARRELARWEDVAAGVAAYRRPGWPVWLAGVVLSGAAVYLGLVIGGYLPVPGFLVPVVDWWWETWDRWVDPAPALARSARWISSA